MRRDATPTCGTASRLTRAVALADDVEWLERALVAKARRRVPSILDPFGFVRSALRVARRLVRTVGEAIDSEPVRSRLRRSTDVDWRAASPLRRSEAVEQLENLVRGLPSEFARGVGIDLDAEGRVVLRDSHEATKRKHRRLGEVDPRFVDRNEAAVTALRETASIFFAREYTRRARGLRERARRTIATGLERGFGRVEIAEALREEFRETTIAESYWETVAANHVGRARAFAALKTYSEAGVAEWEWTSIIDSRTTDVCRTLNGLRFPVEASLEAFGRLEGARGLPDVERVAPFLRTRGDRIVLPSGRTVARRTDDGFDLELNAEQLVRAGVFAPPAHHRCRSVAVPVF